MKVTDVIDERSDGGAPVLSLNSPIIGDVKVALRARLGEVTMTVRELFDLRSGSVVKLDMQLSDPIELRLNDAVVARGEIVAVDDNFGVRIVEIAAVG